MSSDQPNPPAVGNPERRIGEFTTSELSERRGQLEHAQRFFTAKHPKAPILADLHRWLEEVAAEEESRKSIAAANGAS